MAVAACVVLAGIQVVGHLGSSAPGGRPRSPAGRGPAPSPATTTTTASSFIASPATTPSTTAPPPSLFDHKTAATLLLAAGIRLSELDLDHNVTRSLDVPAAVFNLAGQGANNSFVVGRAGFVVFQGATQTFAVRRDLARPPVSLGRSVSFVASIRPDRVWLAAIGPAGPTVDEVDMAGRVTSPVFRLPVDWAPIAAVRTGLLLNNSTAAATSFAVWDPRSGRIIWSSPPAAQLLAANDHLVAWIAGFGCQALCALHLTDVVTGTDRAIYPGGGNPPWNISSGEFSPDGRRLALGVSSGTDSSSGTNGLLLVDTVADSSTFVAISAAAGAIIAWAPSGRWIFTLASDNNSATVEAYPLGGSQAEAVNLPPSVTATAFVAI